MFIVIEGTDGSGKATQTKLLLEYLLKRGYKTKTIDFPRYYDNFWGAFIGQGLNGDFGPWNKIDPHIISTFYALDRQESAKLIRSWLKKNFIVVSDRYTSANQLYQAGKIDDPKERNDFIDWLEHLEFEIFKIPKPDLVIFLDVPPHIATKLLEKKSNDKKKRYSKERKDLHEKDKELNIRAYKQGIRLSKKLPYFRRVVCHKNDKILSPQEIHEKIVKLVQEYLPEQEPLNIPGTLPGLGNLHKTISISSKNKYKK